MTVKSPLNIIIGPITVSKKAVMWPQKQAQLLIPISNHSTQALTLQVKADNLTDNEQVSFQLPTQSEIKRKNITFQVLPNQSTQLSVFIKPIAYPRLGLKAITYPLQLSITNYQNNVSFKQWQGELKFKPIVGPGLLTLLAIIALALFFLILPHLNFTPPIKPFIYDPTKPQANINNPFPAQNAGIPKQNPPTPPISPHRNLGNATNYEEMFKEVAAEYNLDWRMLAVQAYYESRFNPLAVGQKGEQGLMQIMPTTWAVWAPQAGVTDPFDPYSNLKVSAAFQAYLIQFFAQKGHPEPQWVIAAYNWGPDRVANVLATGQGWLAIPSTTQAYAINIVNAATHPALQDERLKTPLNPH